MQLLQSFTYALVLVSVSSVVAEPIQWRVGDGGNGHWYDAVHVAGGVSWDTANKAATKRNGYLATVISAEENNFVFSLIDNPRFWEQKQFGNDSQGPWLGGVQREGSQEPAGGWAWVTGETFSYTAWATGQPNNAGDGKQNRIHYWAATHTLAPTWQDASDFTALNFTGPKGYVVEFDSKPGPIDSQDDPLSRNDLMKLPKKSLVRHCLDLQHRLAELELRLSTEDDVLALKNQVASLEAENERMNQTIDQILPLVPTKPAVEPKVNEVPQAVAPADQPKEEFNPEAYSYKYEILRYLSDRRGGYYEAGPRKARHQKNHIQVRVLFKNETGRRVRVGFFVEASKRTKDSRGETSLSVLGRTFRQSGLTATPDQVVHINVPIEGDHVVDADFIRLIEVQMRPY